MNDCPLGPTDWFFRNLVPTEPEENMRFRRTLLEKCYDDPALAEEARIMCSRDMLFYFNAFTWILEPRDKAPWSPGRWFGDAREIPFITRDYQIETLLELQENVGKSDIVIQKSREMGASWMVLMLMDWYWRFREHTHLGVCSKDEKTMDDPKNPGSLLAKLDFINRHLPIFLRPKRNRDKTKHTIENLDNKSTIAGFAATGEIATGDRFLFFVQDEVHKFPAGKDYAAHDSLQHTTHSRVLVSTVNGDRGMSGVFYDFCTDPNIDAHRIQIHWSKDNDKARGLYTSENSILKVLDKRYKFPKNYKFILDGKLRSPYYDWECRRTKSLRSIAAELDMDFGGASKKFFDEMLIKDCMKKVKAPTFKGRFVQNEHGGFTGDFILDQNGDCDFWMDRITKSELSSRKPEDGPYLVDGKPPKEGMYSIGVDISAGTAGNTSSYSAIVVFDHRTGEQVMMWRRNDVLPHILALLVEKVGKFFNTGLVCAETNGPVGQQFMGQFMQLNYRNPWIRPASKDAIRRKSSGRFGYANNDGGEEILGELQSAMQFDKCLIKAEIIITECGRYHRDELGKLVHPRVGKYSDDAPVRSHGDCAIAAAAAWFAIHDRPLKSLEQQEKEKNANKVPANTYLASRLKYEKGLTDPNARAYWNPKFKKTGVDRM